MAELLALSHPESARPRPPQLAQTGTRPAARRERERERERARERKPGRTQERPRARTPGGGHTAGPSRRRGPRPLPRPRPGRVLVGLPLLGAAVDEVLGSPLGVAFALGTVLGTAWAALLCTRRGLWWVLPTPPLLVAAITVLSQLALHRDQFTGGRSLATASVKWAVTGFPIMSGAILAALAALGLRRALALRGSGSGSNGNGNGNGNEEKGRGRTTRPRVVRPRAASAGTKGAPNGTPPQDPSQVPTPRRSHHG